MTTKENNLPILTIMIGLSGSGKSTNAKQVAEKENAVVISSDEIREKLTGNVENQDKNTEVFKLFHKRIKEALLSGKNVIADATNLTMKSRRTILQNIYKVPCMKKAVVIAKDYDECLEDNKNREHPVPEYILKGQLERFEIPFFEEGFNEIKIINCSKNLDKLDFDFAKNVNRMHNFDQQNPHHNKTLGDHCVNTALTFGDKGYAMNFNLIYAAKYHDIGKLFTQTFDKEGVAHYYHHENVGAYYILTRLTYEYLKSDIILDTLFVINYHMKPFSWQEEKTHARYKRIFGEEKYRWLMDFHECDKMRENELEEEQER